jgi:hypothetical protein
VQSCMLSAAAGTGRPLMAKAGSMAETFAKPAPLTESMSTLPSKKHSSEGTTEATLGDDHSSNVNRAAVWWPLPQAEPHNQNKG